ncbi:MAG: hypothetical protein DI556_22230 [Rhodovulum sulfidophilum]|uniref:Uncharacterized protein n=1 Tax=Rhodovulum sulfidophilum TaxID=35806 RepID=A0A2W5PM43_RHOSU|nr:MAG: hypothetical protein DI556_22230 [Rhodovulum sulfidophilum]
MMHDRIDTCPEATDASLLDNQRDREGAAWFADAVVPPILMSMAPSDTRISPEAVEMTAAFLVGDAETYARRYAGCYWPGGLAGATLGIGYDLGYVTSAMNATDWEGVLDGEWIHKLVSGLGLRGDPGGPALAAFFADAGLSIPWDQAMMVHRERVIPRWTGLVERALPNTGMLSSHQLGALVSLAMSRGVQFASIGDRYVEMRKIAQHMRDRRFDRIPGEIAAMTRLCRDTPGLKSRRQMEAALFATGID